MTEQQATNLTTEQVEELDRSFVEIFGEPQPHRHPADEVSIEDLFDLMPEEIEV